MTFFIYSRKSVDTGKGESIENQIEMCRQYIKTKFPDITDKNLVLYEDEGFSAKNTYRPQFQKMLREIRTQKPDYLVCYRLDRISRNVSDFASLIEELNQRKISFLCIREEFDTSKPMGKAMMYIASVFAQLERETIAERVRDNMLMLARSGRWLGGTPPTGYRSERTQELLLDGKKKTSCKLQEVSSELHTVYLIYQKFIELKSLSGVSKYLLHQDLFSRNGKRFSPLSLKELLQNPVYCTADKNARQYFSAQGADVCFSEQECSNIFGLLAYNKRDYRKSNAPRQNVSQWIIAIGKHKGLVSGKDWTLVQKILSDNNPVIKKQGSSHNDYALLSGLLFCGICGKRMFAKKRTGKNREGLFDYLCSSKLQGGRFLCFCQNIGGLNADKLVWDHLMPYFTKNSAVISQLNSILKDLQREAPVKKGTDHAKEYKEEINMLLSALSRQNLDHAFLSQVSRRIAFLDKKLKFALKKQENAQELLPELSDNQKTPLSLAQKLADWSGVLYSAPIFAKQYFLRKIIRKIMWQEGELNIYIAGSKPN